MEVAFNKETVVGEVMVVDDFVLVLYGFNIGVKVQKVNCWDLNSWLLLAQIDEKPIAFSVSDITGFVLFDVSIFSATTHFVCLFS